MIFAPEGRRSVATGEAAAAKPLDAKPVVNRVPDSPRPNGAEEALGQPRSPLPGLCHICADVPGLPSVALGY